MYFVRRNGKYINCAGESFKNFMQGNLKFLKNDEASLNDWEDHLSTIFTEVRLKQFIEFRGADAGPWKSLCALPAIWVGMLYDKHALNEIEALANGITRESFIKMNLSKYQSATIGVSKILDYACQKHDKDKPFEPFILLEDDVKKRSKLG